MFCKFPGCMQRTMPETDKSAPSTPTYNPDSGMNTWYFGTKPNLGYCFYHKKMSEGLLAPTREGAEDWPENWRRNYDANAASFRSEGRVPLPTDDDKRRAPRFNFKAPELIATETQD